MDKFREVGQFRKVEEDIGTSLRIGAVTECIGIPFF
jgi:hypothetical protein